MNNLICGPVQAPGHEIGHEAVNPALPFGTRNRPNAGTFEKEASLIHYLTSIIQAVMQPVYTAHPPTTTEDNH
jgi:hypothetical protein